jgi:hypothetical protein
MTAPAGWIFAVAVAASFRPVEHTPNVPTNGAAMVRDVLGRYKTVVAAYHSKRRAS